MSNLGDERRMIQKTKPPYQAGGWQRNIAVVLRFWSTYVIEKFHLFISRLVLPLKN